MEDKLSTKDQPEQKSKPKSPAPDAEVAGSPPSDGKKSSKRLTMIGLLVVGFGVILAILLWWQPGWLKNDQQTNPDVAYKYSLSSLNTQSITNKSTGEKLSFSRPPEQKYENNKVTLPAEYIHKISSNPTRSISFTALNFGNFNPPNYADQVRHDYAAKKTKNSAFFGLVNRAKKLVTGEFSSSYGIHFGNPTKFSSSNITKDAWKIDYSSLKHNGSDADTVYKGSLIFLLSKNEYYFFTVSSRENSWQPNQAVWAAELNSLKITPKK